MARGIREKVSFISPGDAASEPEIPRFWEDCLSKSDNPDILYQSPEWLANIDATQPGDLASLACARGADHRLLCLAPLRLRTHSLPLQFGRLRLPMKVINSVEVLGGGPLLARPQSPSDFDLLAHAIIDTRPHLDGLYFHMMIIDTPLWKHLTTAPSLRKRFVPVIKLSSVVYLSSPTGTFDELIARSPSKVKTDLRRQVRRLQEHAGSELRLERITRRDDVPRFLRLGGPVARKSWQGQRVDWLISDSAQWHDHLADLADRRLLRSYLLTRGDTPYSYTLGFQGRGTWYFKMTGYDPAFKEWSPGSVSLFMQIRDVFSHDRPSRIHFGFGDNYYKRKYIDQSMRVAHLFLLRKTLWSRLKHLTEFRKWRSSDIMDQGGPPPSDMTLTNFAEPGHEI